MVGVATRCRISGQKTALREGGPKSRRRTQHQPSQGKIAWVDALRDTASGALKSLAFSVKLRAKMVKLVGSELGARRE
jgi:hypothetical protein